MWLTTFNLSAQMARRGLHVFPLTFCLLVAVIFVDVFMYKMIEQQENRPTQILEQQPIHKKPKLQIETSVAILAKNFTNKLLMQQLLEIQDYVLSEELGKLNLLLTVHEDCKDLWAAYPTVNVLCLDREQIALTHGVNMAVSVARTEYLLVISENVTYRGSSAQFWEGLSQVLTNKTAELMVPKLVFSTGKIFAAGIDLARVPGSTSQNHNSFAIVPRLAGRNKQILAACQAAEVVSVTPEAVIINKTAFLASQMLVVDASSDPVLVWLSYVATSANWNAKRTHVMYQPELEFELKAGAETIKNHIKPDNTISTLFEQHHRYNLSVVWDGYLNDCTGWASEAISIVTPLEKMVKFLAIVGDDSFCPGYPDDTQAALARLRTVNLDQPIDIWVSHKPPPSYPRFPYNGLRKLQQRPRIVVGRSMVESMTMPKTWLNHTDRVDEIWVPSSFLVKVFVDGGVPRGKLHVIPESIDTNLFDPDVTQPLPLQNRKNYNFLSIFKWEERKGYDVLLKAYVSAFSSSHNVCLHLQTYLFGEFGDSRNASRIYEKIDNFLKENDLYRDDLPCIQVMTKQLSKQEMPRLFKAADAFVLPSRGEGWGLPLMEAMAMGLPTITTRFSGPLDFINDQIGYLIPIEKMEKPVDHLYDESLLWARASWTALRDIMLEVYLFPAQARTKSLLARAVVAQHFNEQRVASLVAERLEYLKHQYSRV